MFFQFYPKTGHIRGNSRLEIDGKEFGRKYEDVEEVSIGGLLCETIEKDYVIAKRLEHCNLFDDGGLDRFAIWRGGWLDNSVVFSLTTDFL